MPGETVLDVTLGLGGHAKEFAEAVGESGQLIAIDADVENMEEAKRRLLDVPAQKTFYQGNFRDLATLSFPSVDIILADLGLSSPHVDDASRGFTFREDAPLDMRYDRSGEGQTAASLIEELTEQELTDTFRKYGEFKQAYKLACKLKETFPTTTGELKKIVEEVCGRFAPSVLPQVFQALRIAVNDEMGALEALLQAGPALLKPKGRMGIISYHSLEDRMVKQTFKELAEPIKNELTGKVAVEAPFEILTKKPVSPTEAEMKKNPRARSAKFRALQRRADKP